MLHKHCAQISAGAAATETLLSHRASRKRTHGAPTTESPETHGLPQQGCPTCLCYPSGPSVPKLHAGVASDRHSGEACGCQTLHCQERFLSLFFSIRQKAGRYRPRGEHQGCQVGGAWIPETLCVWRKASCSGPLCEQKKQTAGESSEGSWEACLLRHHMANCYSIQRFCE